MEQFNIEVACNLFHSVPLLVKHIKPTRVGGGDVLKREGSLCSKLQLDAGRGLNPGRQREGRGEMEGPGEIITVCKL